VKKSRVSCRLDQALADFIRTDSKPTFLMWTMSTRTVQLRSTSGSPSSLTIGTVASRADHQEPPNQMTQIRRNASGLLGSEICVMSRSRSRNTSRVLCCEQILCQMVASHKIRRETTSSLQAKQEIKRCNTSSVEWC